VTIPNIRRNMLSVQIPKSSLMTGRIIQIVPYGGQKYVQCVGDNIDIIGKMKEL
jgi:hypothetical protein